TARLAGTRSPARSWSASTRASSRPSTARTSTRSPRSSTTWSTRCRRAPAAPLVLHRVIKPLPEVRDLADILVKAAEANIALIAKLPRLRDMESELEAIGRLESEGDRIYRRLV